MEKFRYRRDFSLENISRDFVFVVMTTQRTRLTLFIREKNISPVKFSRGFIIVLMTTRRRRAKLFVKENISAV